MGGRAVVPACFNCNHRKGDRLPTAGEIGRFWLIPGNRNRFLKQFLEAGCELPWHPTPRRKPKRTRGLYRKIHRHS